MSAFTIYGLRVKGDKEVRYIGQCADVQIRLAGHFTQAKAMPWATNFADWLKHNKDQIEAVILGSAETRDEARKAERAAVAFCLALNHRLYNQWLVPAHKRLAPRGETVDPWKATPTPDTADRAVA